MTSEWTSLWSNLLGVPRATDLLDILLVAILISTAASALRRARSRFVVGGALVAIGLYLVARLLELEVTLTLFRVGLTVAALSLVVIFQEEIRRTFERLSTGGLLRWSRPEPPWRELVDVVAESCATLAEQKVGVLLVFRGREPLGRHLDGGHRLDGVLSAPLLLSLFDSSTPGHDGAVVVEEGRASRFGAHLPLSTSQGVGHMGTRHTAAVGLSERSDALIVVVSEERGAISVARAGTLDVVNPGALRDRLEDFFLDLHPADRTGRARQVLTRDIGLKLLSLLAAVVLWVGLTGTQGQPMSRAFDVPIAYRTPPDHLLLEPPTPRLARVVLSGTRGTFDRLDPSQLLVEVDVSGERPGPRQVPLRPGLVARPAGLTVDEISPGTVSVVAHEAVERTLSVRPRTRGAPAGGATLRSVSVHPSKIPVVARRADVRRLGPVRTEAIELSGLESTTTIDATLLLPQGAHRGPGTPETVRVTVEVDAP